MENKNQVWYNLEQKMLLLSGAFIGLVFLYSVGFINWTIPCAFQHFFSMQCLGCGTTEALKLAFNGNFQASLHSNPLVLILLSYLFLRIAYKLRIQLKQL